MKSILLAFPYNIADRDKFEEIIDRFDNKGYDIHIFNDVDHVNFRIDILPFIIEALKEQYLDGQKNGISRIAVISNIKDVLFSWYRCYNSLADDFIYFIDSDESNFLSDGENQSFYKELYNFNGIENEHVEGKIYLNINSDNYKSIFSFLLANKNFRYFDKLDNFNFDNETEKEKIKKVYHFSGTAFFFEPGSVNVSKTNEVLLTGQPEQKVQLDTEFIELLEDNLYFLVFITAEIYKMGLDYYEGNKFLYALFQHLRDINRENKEKICRDFFRHIEQSNKKFAEKIYFLSLLVVLKLNDSAILKQFMNALQEDNEHMDYHYPILVNTVFYLNKENIQPYDNFYFDRKNELKKIAAYYQDNLNLKTALTSHRRIAILVDQLLSDSHAPSKVILDYAINIKKIYPDYDIKIFIEDNFVVSRSEVLTPFHYPAVSSREAEKEHLAHLNGEDIEIYYSDSTLTKKARTQHIVREIHKYNPEVILATSDISVAREILYPLYPVVFMSHGGINYSTLADIYLHPNREEVIDHNKQYSLLIPQNIHEIKAGLTFSKPYKNISRSYLCIAEKDFVLITAGNRLADEMDEAFFDSIVSFLEEKPNAKWLIVGLAKLPLLEKKYNKQLQNGQIIKIDYEDDLPSLYRICDAYINPIRKGGAHSIAIAMNEGLPVVILGQPSDGLAYVGEEHCAGYTLGEYLNEIRLLYDDKEYRKRKGALMKRRIEQFDFKSFVDQLLGYFELAKKRFAERRKS